MDPMCLAYGAGISIVVSILKRWSWISNNPKWVAAIVATVFSAGSVLLHGGALTSLTQVQTLVTCIVTQLSASVATHEIAVQPIVDAMRGKLATLGIK